MISPIKTTITNNTATDFKIMHYPDCQIYVAAKGTKEYQGDIFSTIANDRERFALLGAVARGIVSIRYDIDGITDVIKSSVNGVLALPSNVTKQIGLKTDAECEQDTEPTDEPADSVTSEEQQEADDSDEGATDSDASTETDTNEDSADTDHNADESSVATESSDVTEDSKETETETAANEEEPAETETAKSSRRRKNIQIG